MFGLGLVIVVGSIGSVGSAGCSTQRLGPARAETTPVYPQIVQGMRPGRIAALGKRTYSECIQFRRREKLAARRTCRWAYLYTAVACDRGEHRSCLLAGQLSRREYGDNSAVALKHFRLGCAGKVKAACDAVDKWTHPFAKPPPARTAKLRRKRNNQCMDEVACLLASNPPACCLGYLHRRRRLNRRTPRRLSRSQIMKGMGKLRGQIRSCGTRHAGKGTVIVRVNIGRSGLVTQATVISSPTAGLGQCVARTIHATARFRRTRNGRSVAYPFLFR